MIQTKYGDLLSVTSGYIVHGCNASEDIVEIPLDCPKGE